MNDIDAKLREIMADRATAITTVPPLPAPLPDRRRSGWLGGGRRSAVVIAVAAILSFGAGVGLTQVLIEPEPPTVTPVTERLVVASGETVEGPWQLTAYRAEMEGQWRTENGWEYGVRTAWCLDLDGPAVEGPGDPPTERANACTWEGEEMVEAIGISARHPEFDQDQALVYGTVSSDVASLDVVREGGQRVDATIVRAPAHWDVPDDYFFAFISGPGKVDLVARDSNGDVLEEGRI